MPSVNLMPPQAWARRCLRRRIRAWSAALVVALLFAKVALGLYATSAAKAAAVMSDAAPLTSEFERVRAQLAETAQACTALAKQIERADALRTKRDWAGLFAMVSERTPPTVWLTGLKSAGGDGRGSHRHTAAAPSTDAAGEAEPLLLLEGPDQLRIEGYALELESLYDFMGALKSAKVFESVELSAAGREPMLRATAVRFIIVCDWSTDA
jgi:Tfp pilus assembly protein PilN